MQADVEENRRAPATPVSTVREQRELLLERLGELLDRSTPSVAALSEHGLLLLAVDHALRNGRAVPDELRGAWLRAAVLEEQTFATLQRIRAAASGRLLVMKGPEVAAHYPRAGLRLWGDVDLVAEDSLRTWTELLRDGFVQYSPGVHHAHHHRPPLQCPETGVVVEVHHAVSAPLWARAPSAADLLAAAVPSALPVDGLLAPAPAFHAVLLAAHAWATCPFRSVRDLLEAELLLCDADGDEATAHARRFGLLRLWRADRALGRELFWRGPPRRSLRAADPLRAVRTRSDLEMAVALMLGPCYADTVRAGAVAALRSADRVVRPRGGLVFLDRNRFAARRP